VGAILGPQNSNPVGNNDFGLISVEFSSKLANLSYSMEENIKCLGMQQFFSENKLQDALIISASYSKLNLSSTNHDLKKNFTSDGVLYSSDLTERYESFSSLLDDKNKFFFNFYCPFRKNDGKDHNMKITLKITQKVTADSEKQLIEESLTRYNNMFSVVGILSTLDDLVSSQSSTLTDVRILRYYFWTDDSRKDKLIKVGQFIIIQFN
jgi:hypothetical protein